MANEKTSPDLAAIVQQQAATIKALSDKLDALATSNRSVTNLLAKTEGQQTPELIAHKEWAQLPAQAKTQLVVDKRYGPAAGKTPYRCEHRGPKGEVTECFPVILHAHSPEEASAFYRVVMGITETKGKITATLAA